MNQAWVHEGAAGLVGVVNPPLQESKIKKTKKKVQQFKHAILTRTNVITTITDYNSNTRSDLYTQSVISKRTIVISTRTRAISTRKVQFPPAE
jgi:hypothetical protein